MKVSELIKLLKGIEGDTLVVLAKDGEGNDFSPLSDFSKRRYIAESTWSGYLEDDEDLEEGESPSGIPALVLWPTN